MPNSSSVTNPRPMTKITIVGILAMLIATLSPATSNAMMSASSYRYSDNNAKSVALALGSGACTGTLIDKNWVITASHCGVNSKGKARGIVVGSKIQIGPDRRKATHRTVSATYHHPRYDAMLLKLNKPVTNVPAAKLYQSRRNAPKGTRTKAYGFGNIWSFFGLGGPKRKVSYSSGEIVSSRFRHISQFPKMYGVNNKLSGRSKIVPGDSGGPLFVGNELYGITSGGRLTLSQILGSTTTVYTPMPAIRDWVEETTRVNLFR